MINFSPTTYGSDYAAKIPDLSKLEDIARSRGEMMIKAEELKLQKALKDKERYLDQLNVDPVSSITEINTTRQAAELAKYNSKWAARLAEKNGQLDMNDEVEMIADKQRLRMLQEKIKSNEARFLEEYEIKKRDYMNRYYDDDYFQEGVKQFYKTGEYPEGGLLSVAPVNPVSYLSKLPTGTPGSNIILEDVKDPKTGKSVAQKSVNVSYRMTEEEAKQAIIESFTDDRVAKGYIKMFESLPAAEQAKWLGDYQSMAMKNPKDSKWAFDDSDIVNNPIVKWATNNDTFIKAAMQYKVNAPQNLPQSGSGGSLLFSFGGISQKYTPPSSMSAKLGSRVVDKYYNFGDFKEYEIPTNNFEAIDINGNKFNVTAKSLKVQPLGYSQDDNSMLFKVLENYKYGNTSGKGEQIFIRLDNLPDEFKKLKIIFNGVPTEIGAIPAIGESSIRKKAAELKQKLQNS